MWVSVKTLKKAMDIKEEKLDTTIKSSSTTPRAAPDKDKAKAPEKPTVQPATKRPESQSSRSRAEEKPSRPSQAK